MFTGYGVGSSSLKASIVDEHGKVIAAKPKNSESSFSHSEMALKFL